MSLHGCRCLVLGLLVVASASAQQPGAAHDPDDHAGEFEQHDAHEHGKIAFSIVLEGGQLVVEFEAPADNVLGFEHAPRTDAEKAVVRDRTSWLQSGKELVLLPSEAACRFEAAKIDAPHWKEGETHADFRARLSYRCDRPQRLEWMQLSLLRSLHEVVEARVNLLTPARQGRETVRSATTRVKLR